MLKNLNIIDLKNYTQCEKVASGQFGIVYKVKDNRNGKIYAAKILKFIMDEARNDDFARNLKRETSIISRIQHPLILKFIGLSMTNFNKEKKPVIVTDYISGGSLKSILDASEKSCSPEFWDETSKLIVIYGIAAAMEFLHSNKIIHRDLKPENILLNDKSYPIIADFGLSKDQAAFNQSMADLKGTPIYIAPEIWEEYIYSKEGDVYSYAFIIYEILANEKPYKNINMIRLQEKVCRGDRPDTSFIPEPFRSLIEVCWSQESISRPMFKDIVQELKTNPEYLTNVDEGKFQSFVDYIDNSPKDFISIVDPKYKKSIDIVFLIDGTCSNRHLINSIQNTYNNISQKSRFKYPNTYFRFGSVVYYNLIESQRTYGKDRQYPIILDLTDSFEEVQDFLNDIVINGGGNNYVNDWACGYHAISDRISWEKKSERIIIHICDSPAHGKYFTIDQDHNRDIKIPYYKKNVDIHENLSIFNEIQEKQNNWFIVNIRRLADEGVKFYCLNGKEIALYCFKQVMKKFIEVGGKKYIVKDLFGFSSTGRNHSVDMTALNAQIEQFVLNVIDACFNDNNQFENECKLQFEKDLISYLVGDDYISTSINDLNKTISKLENEISNAKKTLTLNNSKTIPSHLSLSEIINDVFRNKSNNDFQNQNSIINNLKKENQKLDKEMNDLKNKYDNFELNQSLQKKKINSLKKQNKKIQEENDKLNQELTKFKEENNKLNRELNKFMSKNKELDQEITRLKMEKSDQIKTEREEIDKEPTLLKMEDDKKDYELTQLRMENDKKDHELIQLKIKNTKLSSEVKSLTEKYNSLFKKNHHNYVLIGEMKKILIEDGNLVGDERKLGGIEMTRRALEKKDEIINRLKKT